MPPSRRTAVIATSTSCPLVFDISKQWRYGERARGRAEPPPASASPTIRPYRRTDRLDHSHGNAPRGDLPHTDQLPCRCADVGQPLSVDVPCRGLGR
jgi:hypothetical protein